MREGGGLTLKTVQGKKKVKKTQTGYLYDRDAKPGLGAGLASG